VSGQRAGTSYALARRTRIGRGPENDIVVDGPESATVSLRHAEIVHADGEYRLVDLNSTNGTFLNGSPVAEARLSAPAAIRLGSQGPEFSFVLEESGPDTGLAQLSKTIVIPRSSLTLPAAEPRPLRESTFDGLLSEAAARVRRVRKAIGNETMLIMRETLGRALHRSKTRSRRIIALLAIALAGVSGAAGWKIWDLQREKSSIDRRIQEVEAQLQRAPEANGDTEALIARLENYQREAQRLQGSLFYRFASATEEDLITSEIRTLMAEFGTEVYSVPPDFRERVKHYLAEYQGEKRPVMMHALAAGGRDLNTAREILAEEQLPPELAWIPVVESALVTGESPAGAAGPWQFTPRTARAYGLRVDRSVDERLDMQKSTRAACKYLRELILDFGAGSSVMLALAAYNSGPTKVKQAVLKSVKDPIRQRNFWYLYRVRALPAETREYVPKVAAVMIIGRNPQLFGFAAPAGNAPRSF
jgi:pSer/pThr/pTyr-binding forkhead associated (FHA) protein